MAYTWQEIQRRLSEDGSIYTLKAIHPKDIADLELAFFWGHAKNRLQEFENSEDEVVRVLDRRYAKDGTP